MNIKLLSAAILVMLTGLAKADVSPYWTDPEGTVVRDGIGECVITRNYTPETKVIGCHGAVEEAPKPEPVVEEEPAPEPPEPSYVVESISLEAGAFFAFDSAVITSEGEQSLDGLMGDLRAYPEIQQIRITGHTDSRGSEEYNQGLSERRAQAVRDYLVGRGLSRDMIQASGMGEMQPVASNLTSEGRAQNRRVEVTIQSQRQTAAQQ